MTYLLDTCVLSDFVKGESGTVARLLSLSSSLIAISALTQLEIAYGLLLAPECGKRLRPKLDALFGVIEIVPFGSGEALVTAHIRERLRRRGTPIGPYDLLIAGTALHHGHILVTANTREFSRIPALSLENWRQSEH